MSSHSLPDSIVCLSYSDNISVRTDAPSLTADHVKFYDSCDGSAAYFYDKDRIFNPNTDPKYANDLGLPSLLLMQNSNMEITHMKHGSDFAHAHVPGKTCAETETLVMVVAAREMNGYTAGARWFGHYSGYNRQSLATKDTVEEQILSTTCCGRWSTLILYLDMSKLIKCRRQYNPRYCHKSQAH